MSTIPHAHPPMDPCGPDDIASFAALDLALRAAPELVREGSHTLSAKALSSITAGIRRFQEEHLGKDAKGQRWPMVRIPDSIFRDRSRGGPLYTALLAAYRHKSSQSWRAFDFDSPKRYDDNVAMMRRIERELIAAGHISKPKIYFDATVPDKHVTHLNQIAIRFGGSIVPSISQSTHIIAYDSEIDGEDEIQIEEERDANNEPPDRTYLRTVTVARPGEMGLPSKSGHPMALVHWWFWPSSADEWIPASDVDGDGEELAKRAPGGSWVVCCRFLRDVARFNEWGVEEDYAILEYRNKVAAFRHGGDEKESLLSSLPGSKNSRKRSAPILVGDDAKLAVNEKRDRRSGNGLNPRWISDGTVGLSKEKRKRAVYDGALRISSDARSVVRTLLEERGVTISTGQREMDTNKSAVFSPRVVPFSKDENVKSIVVTELSLGKEGNVVAVNRRIAAARSGLQRIRGGGGKEGEGETGDAFQGRWDIDRVVGSAGGIPPPSASFFASDQYSSENDSDGTETHPQSYTMAAAPSPGALFHPPASMSDVSASSSLTSTAAQLQSRMPHSSLTPNPLLMMATAQKPRFDVDTSSGAVARTIAQGHPTRPTSVLTANAQTSSENKQPQFIGNAAPPSFMRPALPVSTRPPDSSSFVPTMRSVPAAKLPTSVTYTPPPPPTPSQTISTTRQTPSTKLPPPSTPSLNKPTNPIKTEFPTPTHSESTTPKLPTPTPTILPLPKHPPPQHHPQPLPPDTTTSTSEFSPPSWYSPSTPSHLEKTLLPEWFDSSAPHRTPSTYLTTRNAILKQTDKQRYVTATTIRHTIAGDAGSLMRLHSFLCAWGFINGDKTAMESMSTFMGLRNEEDGMRRRRREKGEGGGKQLIWTMGEREELAKGVVRHVGRKRKDGDVERDSDYPLEREYMHIDWDAVASDIGNGATPADCQNEFLTLHLEEDEDHHPDKNVDATTPNGSIANTHSSKQIKETLFRNLVDDTPPNVLKAAIDAARNVTTSLPQIQNATALSLFATHAADRAREEETAIHNLLEEIMQERMAKVENRLTRLDDLEAMLEAERVSLELERRDLYAARCRYWLGESG